VRPSLTTLLHDKRAVAPRRVRPAATRAAAPQLAANDGACWRMPAALHSYPFNENLASIVWSRPVQTAHGPLDDVSAAVRSRDWPKEKRARLFALLPTYAQVRHVRYRSCAVVGSSPEVLLYEDGAEIDRHDAVFRANLAVTRGYEKHVGNRTTVRVINPVASIGEARTPRLGGAAQGGDATIIIKSQDPPAVRDPSSEHEKFLIEQTRRRGPPTADFLARRQVLELCNFLFLQSGVALADPPLAALAVNLSRVERQFDESARTNMARAWHPLGSGIPRFSVAHCSTGTMLLTEALLLCDRVRLFGFHVCDCTRACARGGVSVRNHYWDTKPTAEFGRMAVRYNSHMRYYHRLRDACDVDFDIARLAHCDAPPPPRRGKGVAQPPPV